MGVDLSPGTLVAGRYRLERLLGEGGMGSVWAATHTVTRRRMALKFLKAPERAGVETRQRFLREARAACAVEHPNIVPVHDVFELEDGTPVMVMDLLEGETLRDKLEREGTLSLVDTAVLLLPVVAAVGKAHERGVVHRDLKPENVLLVHTDEPVPKVMVLDLGIAKLKTPAGDDTGEADTLDAGVLTSTGALLGSPCYMAPEQGAGEVDIDHRVDIWALGIMLYEALSGRRPIDGANFGQILKKLIGEDVPPIREAVSDLPDDMAELVGRMLAQPPASLPASSTPRRSEGPSVSDADAARTAPRSRRRRSRCQPWHRAARPRPRRRPRHPPPPRSATAPSATAR